MPRLAAAALAAFAAFAACRKDHVFDGPAMPAAPASTAEVDALWKLAPAKLQFGIVVSPRAVELIDHAWHDVHAFARTLSTFAPIEQQLAKALGEIGRAPDATLAEFGLGPAKGAAMFVVNDGRPVIAILPVVDRAKFVAATKSKTEGDFDHLGDGWCRMVDGGYYACADHREDLALLGTGKDAAAKTRATAGDRGEIEAVLTSPAQAAGVVQLSRGALIVRGTVTGLPQVPPLGPAAQPQIADLPRTGGFAIADLSAVLANVPHIPLGAGLYLDDIAHTVHGPVQVTTGTGEFALDMTVPLTDPAPVKALVEHCADIGPLGAMGAKFAGDTCHVPVPQAWLAVDASVQGNTLHLSSKAEKQALAVPPSPFGEELAKQPWTVAFWGRGTMLAPSKLEALALAQAHGEMLDAMRAFAVLNELGVAMRIEGGNTLHFAFGVRTAWANPDDVVAKLTAISVDDLAAGRGGDAGKAIADAAPTSPFAHDFAVGYSGLVVPSALVGVMAAVAIPAFLDYQQKSKQSEAGLNLEHLSKLLKVYAAEHTAFPVGDAGPTPDFPTCCGLSGGGSGVDNRCPTLAASWQNDKVWSAIGFSIGEPTHYRYSYHSDGKTFAVQAIGDLDCDGHVGTFTLHGEMQGDQPSITLEPPAHGAY